MDRREGQGCWERKTVVALSVILLRESYFFSKKLIFANGRSFTGNCLRVLHNHKKGKSKLFGHK